LPSRASVRRLKNAPLLVALCQVRFAQILDLAERMPALQREFKTLGFPRFAENQFPNVIVVQDGPPQVQLAKQWHFQTADRDATIVLTTGFVTFLTSSYHTFERLLQTALAAVTHLKTIGGIDLIDRVGLRYVDLIRPRQGESIGQYVQSVMLGLPAESLVNASAERLSINTDTRFRTPAGTLAVRLRQLQPGSILPPDLDALLLKWPVVIRPDESAFALDCDHYRDELNIAPDIGMLEKLLWDLHGGCAAAFEAAVMPHALSVWGPTEEITP
jgi:uncharacterized protein (TIGR04255 family)